MPPNEVDSVMDLLDKDPQLLTPRDVDALIAYYRKARAKQADGVKPKREAGPKLDISGITKALVGDQPKTPTIKRRV